MAFPTLAFVFGLLFYAASSGLAALTLRTMAAWPWWAALVPLALCHGISGFIAMASAAGTLSNQTRTVLLCALASVVTTLLTLAAAIWAATAVPPPMSHDVAMTVVLLSLLGGLAGLVAAWRVSQRRPMRSPRPRDR